MAKKKIKYVNGELPENISDVLFGADEQDLRILALLLMAADENGEVSDSVSVEDILRLSKAEVDASLKFWRGAGIIGSARSSRKKVEESFEEQASLSSDKSASSVKTAHRNGVVEHSGVENYGSLELATLLESRAVSACFVDEAQKVFGKTFNSYDTSIVVGLVDQYGFEEEAVLEILAYVLRLGKKGVKYAEKVAIGFYDDGITTAVDVVDRINSIERTKESVYKIKQMFGFGSRDLTKSEQELFKKWLDKYGYSTEAIRIAYEITVNAIQKPAPKYTDKIIEKWYGEGLRTVEEIEEYEKKKRDGGKSESDPSKSYELDDFFDAALKRSFNDLK